MRSRLSSTSSLEKGHPKFTEGGPVDAHWPISRINLFDSGKKSDKEHKSSNCHQGNWKEGVTGIIKVIKRLGD